MTSRILAIGFRDPAHPDAGGSEVHLDSILREAVRGGIQVTWLASSFPGASPHSVHSGIQVVRRGSWWNFNLLVPRLLRREFARPPPDLIIENVNKVPFFSRFGTKSRVAVIVPHLFGATAFREASVPVALYVLLLEAFIRRAYRGSQFLAISESTRNDLLRRGVSGDRVAVVPCGIDHGLYRPIRPAEKSPQPTILYLGRLRRYKGLDWVLRTLPQVVRAIPEVRLQVVGRGPYREALERLAARLSLGRAVEFLGYLPDAEKVARLQEAWVLVQPSPKEGWGLTVLEAGACGTAVVAADSPGLRDSVHDGETGILVPYGEKKNLSKALLRLLMDGALRERLAEGGKAWAIQFQSKGCAKLSLDVLLRACSR